MSRILLPPWRTQPQFPAPVDRGAPINRGLVLLAPLGPGDGYRDLATGRPGTATGLTGRSGSTRGVYPQFGTGSYLDLTLPGGISGTTPTTIAFTYRQTAQTDGYPCLLSWKPTGASQEFALVVGSTGGYYFVCGPLDGGTTASEFGSGPSPLNVDRAVVITLSAGTDSGTRSTRRCWINGAEQADLFASSFIGSTTAGFALGRRNSSGANPLEGLIGNFHLWNRVLTPNEAQAWTLNPFMTRQPTRRLWMASASSDTATATPAAGVATTSAVGAATATGAATAATGLATVAAIGAATAVALATLAAGVATTSAAGTAVATAAASAAAGIATTSAAGASTASAAASAAAGIATTSAVGASTAVATATAAAGTATVSGVGGTTAADTAAAVVAQGVATVSAAGASTAAAAATAASGTATTSAVGASTISAAASAAAGTATASAVGASTAAAVATTAAGTATVSAVGGTAAADTAAAVPAAGTAAVSAIGASTAVTAAVPAAGIAIVSATTVDMFVFVEDRLYTVIAQDRTSAIAAQNRTLTITRQGRSTVVTQ